MRERMIVEANGIPMARAIRVLDTINIDKVMEQQIKNDCLIVCTSRHVVYIETKKRKSIGVVVCAKKEMA